MLGVPSRFTIDPQLSPAVVLFAIAQFSTTAGLSWGRVSEALGI